jgi:16S rRNA (guanine966-N2)-methyltransferase
MGMTTRPTLDRAREAIFSMLGPLDDANVIDVYAGTGAMGIEALSRGAAHATFIESDRAAQHAIRENLVKFGALEQATLIESSAEKAAARLAKRAPYDLVLADPPWDIAAAAALVVAKLLPMLAPGARVLLGHRASEPLTLPPETGLTLADSRKWGGSGMSFYEISKKTE